LICGKAYLSSEKQEGQPELSLSNSYKTDIQTRFITSLLSFKFPTATGAVDAHCKPKQILFQKFMFDHFVALTAAYFVAKVFSSMLIFYF
jgi:hypothetical protein